MKQNYLLCAKKASFYKIRQRYHEVLHRSEPKLNHIPCIILEKRSASDLEKTLKFSSEKIIQIDTEIRGILSMKKVEIQRDIYAINELSLAQCLSFLLCLFFNRKTLRAVSRKKGSFVSWFKLFIKKYTIFGFLFQKIVVFSNTNCNIHINS